MNAPPAALVGVRMALEPGRGRTAVPVRSSLVGASIAVAGVVATAIFGASLDRLVTTPARYGFTADFAIVDVRDHHVDQLLGDARVESVAVSSSSSVRIEGRDVAAHAFELRRGSVAWTLLRGRMPAGPDEVSLGARLARSLDRGPGDEVEVVGPDGAPHRLEVVGVGLWPSLSNQHFGITATFTPAGLARLAHSEPFREALVEVRGPDAEGLARVLARDLEVARPDPPPDVANVGQLRRLPVALGAFLAAVGVATLVHALGVAVRRRRRDLAVLGALGFTRRQLGGAVLAMALTTALVGVAVGGPTGLAVGNVVWRTVAHAVAVADDSEVPAGVLVLVAPVAVAVAIAAAGVPARRAARLRPAEALRSE